MINRYERDDIIFNQIIDHRVVVLDSVWINSKVFGSKKHLMIILQKNSDYGIPKREQTRP